MSLAIRLSCVTGLVLVAPIAAAEPLTTREILKALPGEWGWPEEGDAYDAHSCKSDPTQIWFENNDTIYKSRAPSMNGVLVSRVGIPASLDGTEPTEILISYLNLHQRGLFGQQVVWLLSMPDHDTIVWRAVPGGREVRPLVRCGAGDKVG